MPWQFGALNLTEGGGNHLFRYMDMLVNGASPNDGYAIYANSTDLNNIFSNAVNIMNGRSG